MEHPRRFDLLESARECSGMNAIQVVSSFTNRIEMREYFSAELAVFESDFFRPIEIIFQ
jgi:hypothetical protein